MRIWQIFLIVVIALVLGVGVAVWRIASIAHSNAFAQYGSWRGTTSLALNKDNLVTTQVTVFALFALPSYEAVYLFAAQDDKNIRLRGSSKYSIEGNIHNIKAAYWSITAYGKDLYLIPNEADRYSFNANNLQTDSAGNFKIILSAEKSEGNWLPLKKEVNFQLVLRLYQGNREFLQSLDKAQLPVIKKIE